MFMRILPLILLALYSGLSAQTALNPPPGIPIPDDVRERLETETAELKQRIDSLQEHYKTNATMGVLVDDIIVYYNAVHYALVHNQFYSDKKKDEFEIAFEQLETGRQRAAALEQAEAPWTRQKGLVARGYRSKIDDSVQPYGLVIPESYDFDSPARLDIWYHGRGNTLSELKFIDQRENDVGKLVTDQAIVLHPFGRYCNANKFAGEVDTFEALEHVQDHYPINPDRVTVRGFSMGGAAVWQMATHHADQWSAAAPGAGFAESAVYANVMAKDPKPAWYELKLHALYDATKYAANLHQCPTVAYSGSEDKQKQAADIMAEYMKKENMDLMHVIGEGMGHKYDDPSLKIINATVDNWAQHGKAQYPDKIEFVTYSLRYNQMHWITVDALKEHWEEARVSAEITGPSSISIETQNVTALTIEPPLANHSFAPEQKAFLKIDSKNLELPADSQTISLSLINNSWQRTPDSLSHTLSKRHGLQGPIDDAFMDSFIFVLPSGDESNRELSDWVAAEAEDARVQWWRQFRGEAQVKRDYEITAEDIQNNHLILWGDPSSNQILQRIQNSLPVEWSDSQFTIHGKSYEASTHQPVLIFPNPLNPHRYVVLNSSFTFSEFSGGTNSLQIPKLPDWAVIDISIPRHMRHPNGVVDAGFFDEAWQF
jgi:predicted peptidase